MSSGNSYYNPYGSAPSRCVVDLSQLSTDSLSRYLTRFGIALPPDSSRFDFIEAVSRHYDVRLEVGDEEDVLARFVDCVRKAGLKEHPNQFEIRQYQDGQPMMGRDYDVMQHQHPQAQQQPAPQPQQFHPAAAQARPGMQHPGGSYMDQQHMYDPGMMMPHQGYPHPGFGRMPDQYGYGPMAAGEYPEEMGQYGGRRNAGMGEQQPQRKRRPKQNKNNVSAGGQTTGRESPNSRDDDSAPYPPEDSQFIACDHSQCEKEWYPLSEVGLTSDTIPEGEWYCPQCRAHPDDFSVPAEVPRNSNANNRKRRR